MQHKKTEPEFKNDRNTLAHMHGHKAAQHIHSIMTNKTTLWLSANNTPVERYDLVLKDKTASQKRAGCDSPVSFKAAHSYQSNPPLNRPLGS